MRRSEYMSIDLEDIVRSVRLAISSAVVGTVIPSIVAILNTGRFPSSLDWRTIGITSLGSMLGYLSVKYFSNSKDQFLRKDD